LCNGKTIERFFESLGDFSPNIRDLGARVAFDADFGFDEVGFYDSEYVF
jgi:hypothetical protein